MTSTPETPPSGTDPAALGFLQGLVVKLIVIALGAVLLALAAVGCLVYKALTPMDAFLTPAGGPGWARSGAVDDANVKKYARAWLKDRWDFTPETYEDVMASLLQRTHPSYTETLRAEMQAELRQVRAQKVSSRLIVTEVAITKRRNRLVWVTVTGQRTLYLGREESPPEMVEGRYLVAPWLDEDERLSGLVMGQGRTVPDLPVAKR
jgi:TraE protein